MHELIAAIKEWPVIVQGALGSALFWLVLIIGQWIRRSVTKQYSLHSRQARVTWLVNEQTKYEAATATTEQQATLALGFVLYRASRPLLRALMWMTSGLMMDAFLSPAGLVAYLIALNYLFKAFDLVGPIDDSVDPKARLEQVTKELEQLDKPQGG